MRPTVRNGLKTPDLDPPLLWGGNERFLRMASSYEKNMLGCWQPPHEFYITNTCIKTLNTFPATEQKPTHYSTTCMYNGTYKLSSLLISKKRNLSTHSPQHQSVHSAYKHFSLQFTCMHAFFQTKS